MRGGDGKRRRGECQGGGRIFEARSRSRLVRHDLRPCVFQLRRRGPRLHRARCSTLVDRQLDGVQRQAREELAPWMPTLDRKSVVQGKSVSVRVDLGGRRILKTKENTNSRLTRPNYSIQRYTTTTDNQT